MRARFIKHTTHFVLLVVALQILNMGMSGRIVDDNPSLQVNDSVNIADHAIEFIAENILGFTNAFPEIKENNHQRSVSNFQKAQQFTALSFCKVKVLSCWPVAVVKKYHALQQGSWKNHTIEIFTPPPKTA